METAVAKVEAQREQAAGQLAETQLEVPAERTAQEPVQRTAKAPEQKRPEPEPEVPRTPEPESRKAAGKPEPNPSKPHGSLKEKPHRATRQEKRKEAPAQAGTGRRGVAALSRCPDRGLCHPGGHHADHFLCSAEFSRLGVRPSCARICITSTRRSFPSSSIS